MKRQSQSLRRHPQFSGEFHKSLAAYSVGAAAAGVALLSLAAPAEAEIVYTPANVRIAPRHETVLDLDQDGAADFVLRNGCYNSSITGCILTVEPKAAGNGIWAHGRADGISAAVALHAGVPVGPSANFASLFAVMAFAYSHQSGGHWANVTHRYLGLEFVINGELHYGWARLTVIADKDEDKVVAQLTGFAYETEPNVPIKTGQTSGTSEDASLVRPQRFREPAQLGLLALGSQGLAASRRDPANGLLD